MAPQETPRGREPVLWLLLVFTSLVLGTEDRAAGGGCSDLHNTTWLEYRQHRTQLQVRYLLLTRRHPDCAQAFSLQTLDNTPNDFNASRATKVIVHGYRAVGSKPSWVKQLAGALLRAEDVNVVVVDWVYGASFAYNLVEEEEEESNAPRPAGLDPAGPMFKGADTYNRLDASDARFVDAIHTDSDYFGISIPVGHVDFFLNGGNDQTGCARSRFNSMYGYVICDHMRALHVYMSALNGSCPLAGIPCSSYEDFLKGRCLSPHSGITVSPLPKEQKLFLLTTSSSPFCLHHILLQVEVSPLDKSAVLEVVLTTDSRETEQRLRLHTGLTGYLTVLAHPDPLCEIASIRMKNTGTRGEEPLCVNNINVRRGAPWSHDFVQVCAF
ncbi:Phospholipase A1 member A [Liparis tanakae]|uniref:Phospholipase A1 member A n=1 Tax=Liparis tanakae TaxID=230148 RepID=A0A4Z2G0X2_9TELE|nr:Phospholipase A1 member A [Liparis tanakae]